MDHSPVGLFRGSRVVGDGRRRRRGCGCCGGGNDGIGCDGLQRPGVGVACPLEFVEIEGDEALGVDGDVHLDRRVVVVEAVDGKQVYEGGVQDDLATAEKDNCVQDAGDVGGEHFVGTHLEFGQGAEVGHQGQFSSWGVRLAENGP